MTQPAPKRPWLPVLLSYSGRARGKMVGSVTCSVLSAAFGLVPFYAVYQVMQAVMDQGTTSFGAVAGWLTVAAAGYVVSTILFGVSTLLSHISAYTILESLRGDVVAKLERTSLGTAMSRSVGQVKSVFVDRIEQIEIPLAHMIPELSGNGLIGVGIIVWLACIDWRLALACLVTIPIGMAVFAAGLASHHTMYAAYMDQSNRVNSVMVEYIEGIEVVKTFNQTSDSYRTYADAVARFRDFALGWLKATWVGMNLSLAILPTTLFGVLPVGLWLYLSGAITPAQLGIALILAVAVVDPMLRLTTFLNLSKSIEFAVADADDFLSMPELAQPEARAAVHGTGIALNRVSFSYADGVEVIHDLSLNIPQGRFVALVGPSGGGKSTIARLIVRHWDVTSGSLSVGGVDVRSMPLDQVNEMVSYVTQDNYLFDCSLIDNIRMGRPGATDDEVLAAARAASCDEFIARLPRGYDTPAGEAGDALSGGERQRICLARAIVKDAPIVVLDEATAFADPENEDRIQRSLAHLTQGKTLVVIAHRLSTVTGADSIVVIDDGRVAAQGTHRELLSDSRLYQDLWEAHRGSGDSPSGHAGRVAEGAIHA